MGHWVVDGENLVSTQSAFIHNWVRTGFHCMVRWWLCGGLIWLDGGLGWLFGSLPYGAIWKWNLPIPNIACRPILHVPMSLPASSTACNVRYWAGYCWFRLWAQASFGVLGTRINNTRPVMYYSGREGVNWSEPIGEEEWAGRIPKV